MGKHSPGPWQSKHDFDEFGLSNIIGNVDGETFADGTSRYTFDPICIVDTETAEWRANARLIAAAPDLLAALKALHQRYVMAIGNEGPEALSARAAIAKAEGR